MHFFHFDDDKLNKWEYKDKFLCIDISFWRHVNDILLFGGSQFHEIVLTCVTLPKQSNR